MKWIKLLFLLGIFVPRFTRGENFESLVKNSPFVGES
jgi:hypothetical protein